MPQAWHVHYRLPKLPRPPIKMYGYDHLVMFLEEAAVLVHQFGRGAHRLASEGSWRRDPLTSGDHVAGATLPSPQPLGRPWPHATIGSAIAAAVARLPVEYLARGEAF